MLILRILNLAHLLGAGGRNLEAGRAIRANARMIITQTASEQELLPAIERMAK